MPLQRRVGEQTKKIVHGYEEEDDDFADERDLQYQFQQCIRNNTVQNQVPATRANMPEIGEQHCKCGPTTYQ